MTAHTKASRFEIDAEVIAADQEYRNAQRIFKLAAQSQNQAEISAAARLVSSALDQLVRAKQNSTNP